jgi:DNA (cytosine-5)-methyltransferase 1
LQNNPGIGSEYTPEVRRFFSLVPEGRNWRSLPPKLQEKALGGAWEAGGGKTGFYRRLAWDTPSPTITGRANRKGSALCHPAAARPVSVRECAALQGFPDDWVFSGSMAAQYVQIGNAVPIALGKAIATSFRDHEVRARRLKDNETLDFDEMLNAAVARLRASARNKRPPKRQAA